MGKTRPPERNKRKKSTPNGKASTKSPTQLLAEAAELLEISEPQAALKAATKALKQLRQTANAIERLPALALLGETSLQLGDIDSARAYFIESAEIDKNGEIPEERGGGPEKFFWLAQLSEEGGLDSVKWYEKGADVLRKQIAVLVAQGGDEAELDPSLYESRVKLANALCGIAEVYMTDLSFDDAEAEQQCNKVIEEALSVAPDQPSTLQTAASVRISQLRKDDARQLLRQSLELWKDLDIEDPDVPDFAARISLSRLLMEAEMEDEAIEVLERLIREDDHSVEAWYLGGWCLHLLASKEKETPTPAAAEDGVDEEEELLRRSRKWLLKSLDLYKKLDYEDDRLREHALELVQELNKVLGELEDEDDDDSGEEEGDWEDAESEDEEMVGG
jgi:tetratricopeptide (TPR) repeat protein